MKKQGKVFLSIFFVLTLLFTAGACAAEEAGSVRPEKVDTTLWEKLEVAGDDELIPIELQLPEVDEGTVLKKLKTETGLDADIYWDNARFEQEVASRIRAALEGLSMEDGDAIRAAFSGELKDLRIDPESMVDHAKSDTSFLVNQAILEAMQQFHAGRLRVLAEEQTAQSNAFIEAHVQPRSNEVTYVSSYTSVLFLQAKKSDILFYAQLPEVAGMWYIDPDIQFADS